MKRLKSLAVLGALLFPMVGAAQDFNVSEVQMATGATTPASTIVFTAPAAGEQTTSFSFTLTFDNTKLTFGSATTSLPSVQCTLNGIVPTEILCFGESAVPLTAIGNVTMTINFTAGATLGITPLTLSGISATGTAGADQSATAAAASDDGSVDIVAGPTAPTAQLGAVTPIGAGAAGQTGTGSVAVTVLTAGAATGGPASLTIDCSIPAGANSFAVTTGDPRTISAPATVGDNPPPIGVSCVRGATLATATLTCTQTPVPAAVLPNLTAQIDCPAGGVDPPDLSYNPATGTTINYLGNAGTTQNRPITVSRVAGAAGQGQAGATTTVQNCVPPAGFIVGGTPLVFPGGSGIPASGQITTSCVVPAAGGANLTGTLTCDEVQDAGVGGITTVPRSWTLNCPAAAPNFSSSPAPGGTISISGPPGTTASGSLSVTNTGSADLTFTCTSGTFTVTNGVAAALVPGGNQVVGVSCTTPTAPGTSLNGTVVCSTNDPDLPSATIAVSCASLVVSIPTISAAGKTLLAALLMGLGLLGFAMRRRLNA